MTREGEVDDVSKSVRLDPHFFIAFFVEKVRDSGLMIYLNAWRRLRIASFDSKLVVFRQVEWERMLCNPIFGYRLLPVQRPGTWVGAPAIVGGGEISEDE